MGKAKPVKKAAQSPLKISTSLFQRKSKTSQGAGLIDWESSAITSPKKTNKWSNKGKQTKNFGGKSSNAGKAKTKATSSKKSPLPTKQSKQGGKKVAEKRSSSPVETKGGKEKAASSSTNKGKGGSVGRSSSAQVKTPKTPKGKAAKRSSSSDVEKTKSTSSTKKAPPEKGKSRFSRKDKSPSPSTRRSPESERITTRKRSQSDSESPPPQKMTKVGEKAKATSAKKGAAQKKATVAAKEKAKKVTKKAVAVVASKKKTIIKPELSAKALAASKARDAKEKKRVTESKARQKKKPIKAKPKAKPRTKIKLKRMASLNAKAILEASFSFEPSEKKRSPAPSSSHKSKVAEESVAPKDGKDVGIQETKSPTHSTLTPSKSETKKKTATFSSVSTSTSPTPPEIPEPPPPPPKTSKSSPPSVKAAAVEKKRKSSTGSNRRESTSSTKSNSKDTQTANLLLSADNLTSIGTSPKMVSPVKHETPPVKAGSRRSSASGSISVTSDSSTSSKTKEKMSKNINPKKKQKGVAATTTTSTSTSTSPIPMWNECDTAVEKFATAATTVTAPAVSKPKKQRSNSNAGRDKVQDSGSQVQPGLLSHHHSTSSSLSSSSKHKSASYQAKEKPTTPVALYGSGTVYQPAGPLIEPHKQSSVPAGILPETVRLPPDLKVTYQTHPPPSAFVVSPEKKTKASSSSSKSHKSSSSTTSSSSTQKSEKSAGTILHQPYKSSTSSSSHSSSPSLSRNVQSSYSSGSGYASSTGTPLLSPSDGNSSLISSHHHQVPSASVSVAPVHGSHLGASSSSLSLSALHHPQHSITPGGSIAVGGSQQNPGAPSSSGLYYATNYGPHHSPFAPCKYPIVPPDSYRAQSPFTNSFLCPPTTPQPSQSYFMTPFYTPPLTPNPTPGIGTVGPSQPRPLSLTAVPHHPTTAAAAAAAYYQSGQLSQGPSTAAAHLTSNYYLPSPQHHSIHPTAAPGHAGLFRPNQSSQPACPCPTDSYPLSNSSTNSNTRPPPLQQRPSLSSGSLPGPEAGAKQPKLQSTSPALMSVTAARPSRNNREMLPQPPICITPAVAADPPTAIQVPNISGAQQTQARQLESAKTFTEQYSLPDDITITPIMAPNSSPSTTAALLMLNSSVSVIPTSAPSITTTSVSTSKSNSVHDGLLKLNNSCNHLPNKRKEKDIVHVIDPRSGQRTTIAKHISNNNRIAGNVCDTFKNKTQLGKETLNQGNVGKAKTPSRMETVRKLNPDLDVIVINNGGMNRSDKIENIQTLNLSTSPDKVSRPGNQGQGTKPMPPLKLGRIVPNKTHPVPFSVITSSVMGLTPGSSHQLGKRVALAHNDNNFHRNGNETAGANSILKMNQKKPKSYNSPQQSSTSQSNISVQSPYSNSPRNMLPDESSSPYSYQMPILPPGISISAGSNNSNDDLDNMQPTNLSKKMYSNTANYPTINRQSVQVNQAYLNTSSGGTIQKKHKAIKRSLNECIDGLQLQHQQKKLKMLEQQSTNSRMSMYGNGSPSTSSTSARTGIYNVNGGKPTFTTVNQRQIRQQGPIISNYKSRPIAQKCVIPQETATAARVRDPDYELRLGGMLINSSDAMTAVSALVVEPFDYSMSGRLIPNVEKNGLNKRGKVNTVVKPSTLSSFTFAEAKRKANKLKRQAEKVATRSIPKSKIRTRLSVKPKGLHGGSQQPLGSRSRSRLLRKRSLLCNPNANTSRKSESDSSVCASRSSSSVRILAGSGQNGAKVSGKEKEKEKPKNTQAFLNATADLYQYRRSVILRVPSPKPASSRPTGAESIARFGDSAVVSTSPEPPASSNAEKPKTELPRELAAHQMAQLARSHIMANQPASNAQESRGPAGIPRFSSGSMVVNALKKRAGLKPLSPASVNGALTQQLLLNSRRQPKWSNGWTFEGEPYDAKIYMKNDDPPVTRKCYPSMRHDGGDVIRTRDCVLLKSGPKKNDLPFIAKIAALWENPGDGEMMFSLLWYYRPEHTELGRTKDDMMDEIFASKHRDTNSVATIEDRCYVLTLNEYCRYRRRLKQLEQGIPDSTLVPFAETAMVNTNAAAKIAEAVWDGINNADPAKTMAQGKVSPEVVFFCRKVYDFRQKRILKNPS